MTSATTSAEVSLVAVVGATGTGKSAFALDVADALAATGRRAEIVNADAMQLYVGMDIGTAKLSVVERRGIPHHLFDVLDVTEEASVARYQSEARDVIADIHRRDAVAIVVGGSGLYVSSVLFDFQFPGTDAAVRARLEDELATLGPGILARRLADLDAPTAAAIGSTNGRRIVRALEVIEITGEPAAARLPDEPVLWRPHQTVMLTTPREVLVDRLDRRVEGMWRDGIIDEVRGLLPQGIERGVTARRAIGYSQAIDEIAGALTSAEAIAETQRLTRRYARRQVSWFARYQNMAVIDSGEPEAVSGQITRLASLD